MNVCLFCGRTVVPASADGDVVWADAEGALTCTAEGATGSHYPGHEADLFWRGSEIVDLTDGAEVVDLTASERLKASDQP